MKSSSNLRPHYARTCRLWHDRLLENRAAAEREVGRDTPSFEQALLDALREDPDVLMVGEMRDPETMRLTLNAAETGHLVLATVHSGTCAEALQRVVSAFPAEIQSPVAAQLAEIDEPGGTAEQRTGTVGDTPV